MLFDGTNDNITFASGPTFSGSGTMTFEAWVNPSSIGSFQTIVSWTDGSNNEARLSINTSGFLDLFQTDGVQSGSQTGSVAISANEWTHIAFVQTSGSIDFYVNGAQESEGFNVASAGTSGNFTLGIYSTSFNPYGGLMDEVRVWSSALSQTNIRDQMFKTLAGNELNLTSYYQFNETTGTTLPDQTASSFDGTLVNFPATTDPNWQESGTPPKNALDFDGGNDYVNISAVSSTMIGAESDFSVEFWANLEPVFTDSRRGSIFSVNDGGGANLNRILLYIHDGSDVGKENRIGVVDAGINPDFDIIGPIIADDTWHHVAYTRSGTTGTLYVDGLSVGTHTADFTFQSGDLWSLGQEFDGSTTMSDFIDGQLDDVRIWDVARTEAEIQANMFSDLTGSESNLIAYYDFNQGFADGSNTAFTTLIDRTSNNYDGFLGSFTLTGTFSNWVSSGAQVPAPEITVYEGDDNTQPEVFSGQPKPVNFGHTSLSVTKPRTFTIENNGFDDLVISDITTTGDFSITSSTSFTVTAGSSNTFTSELLALSDGIANGTITIQTNDPNEMSFVFPVTGTKGTLSPKAYWTDEVGTFNDEIDRVDLTGANGQNAYYSGFSVDIKGIAIDTENNMVFWTNTDAEVKCGRIGDSGFVGTNTVVDESGGSAQEFNGIDVDGENEKIYWCDAANNQIRRVDFDGGNAEVLISVTGLQDIALDLNAGKMYYLVNGANAEVRRANLDGTGDENLITKAGNTFRGIALDLVNGLIYWTENGNIQRSNLDGSSEATQSTQLTDPGSIDLDVDNEMMYVIDQLNNSIVSISMTDVVTTIQSGSGVTDPQYLALDTRTMTPLTVVSSSPESNETGVNSGDNIIVTFDQNVNPFTLDNSTVLVVGSETGEIGGTISGGATNVITFNPTTDFKAGETIQLTLTSDLESMGGGSLTNGFFLDFKVASNPAPNVPPLFVEGTVYDDGTNTGVDRVVSMDVNMDGNMDIVSIYEGIDDGVAWYQNDGSQQFTRNVAAVPSMTFAETVAAADLDLDGDIDLLGAYNGRLDWYDNDGSFNFTTTFIYQVGVGFGVQDIQVVDFDADGDLDIVGAFVSNFTHFIRWFENDGNANFTNNIIYSSTVERPSDIEVIDVDEDGDADVLASFNGDAIGWLENDGAQNFSTPTLIATSLTSQYEGLTAGDFNGDGTIDLAMTTTTQISWFANDGSENFSENVISASIGNNDIHAADLDGDGDTDLVGGRTHMVFYDNDGSGNFSSRSTATTTGIEDVFTTDLDSDGDLDVIVGGRLSRVVWFENTTITAPEIDVYIGSDNTGTALIDAQVTPVDIGSALITNDITQTFAIENTGDAVLTVSSITSSLTNYTISGIPSSVGVGATETFTVTLDGTNAGIFNTTITIANNDSNENPFTFPIIGEISSPEISVFVGNDNTGTPIVDEQATVIDLGISSLTVDLVQNFAIESAGATTLTVSSITSSNPAYTISNIPTSIDIGTTETFTVTLDGSSVGTFDAVISIVSNDLDESPFTFSITGEIGTNQPPDISYIFYLDENSPNGTTLGAVVATDPEGDQLTYSIVSGNTNNAFSLGSTSGILTVNDETALDFETTPVFNLVVQADDGNGGVSMVDITINLNDIIDENPLGLSDLENQIKVYPNPASERVFIKLEGIVSDNLRVDLFTIGGSQLTGSRVVILDNDLIEVDLVDLKSGIYLLKIKSDNEVITKNVLVK